ncbi:MAG: DUF6056 family protein [Flavobacteriales bacterium]|nr:DUF6056 family protein [Flavobacteriales bacterium]
MRDSKAKYLFKLSGALFVALYVVFCFYNKFALDDFYFIYEIKDSSIFNALVKEYGRASSRWSSVFVNFTFLKFFGWNALLITRLLQLFIGWYSILFLIRGLKEKWKFPLSNSGWTALFVLMVLFFLTINKAETWFWYCASFTYLWSVFALFFIIGSIFQKESLKNYLILAISSVYFSGTSAPLILIFFLGLLIIGFKRKLNRQGIVSSILVLIGFIILYNGPGNLERESYFEEMGWIQIVWINIKSTIKILVFKIWPLLPFALCLFMPILFIPQKFFDGFKGIEKIGIVGLSSALFVVLFMHHLPIAYKIQDIAPDRTMTPFTIYFLVYLFILTLQLNRKFRINPKIRMNLLQVSLVLVSLMVIGTFVKEICVASDYAKANEQRMELISDCEDGEELILSKLPPSGWVMSAEVDSNPNHWKNEHLKNALNTSCLFRIE